MSLAAAKTALYGVLCSDTDTGAPAVSLVHVVRVYRNEPRTGDMASPMAVSVISEGMTGLDVQVAVRIYMALDAGAQAAQDILDTTVEACERVIEAGGSGFVRGPWTIGYDQALDRLVASCSMSTARTDY